MSQSVVKCQKEPEDEEEQEDVKKKARRALLPGDALVGMMHVGLVWVSRVTAVDRLYP